MLPPSSNPEPNLQPPVNAPGKMSQRELQAWQQMHVRDMWRIFRIMSEFVDGFEKLSRLEGIIPALESAHAIAYVLREGHRWKGGRPVVVSLSGRGDKDVAQVAELTSHLLDT